jgi:hypothetical protein
MQVLRTGNEANKNEANKKAAANIPAAFLD